MRRRPRQERHFTLSTLRTKKSPKMCMSACLQSLKKEATAHVAASSSRSCKIHHLTSGILLAVKVVAGLVWTPVGGAVGKPLVEILVKVTTPVGDIGVVTVVVVVEESLGVKVLKAAVVNGVDVVEREVDDLRVATAHPQPLRNN
jgi:hypothetical protein